jgi:hypothetical protein
MKQEKQFTTGRDLRARKKAAAREDAKIARRKVKKKKHILHPKKGNVS